MRSIWKRKWVVVPMAVAIVLAIGAVGAVALAGPGDQDGTTSSQASAQLQTATTSAPSPGATLQRKALKEQRKALQQQRLERSKQRWTQTRAKMTPADQATYDRLTQAAKDQQAALQKARQDLKDTLKQMRDLVQKYRPQSTTSTTAAPTSQVQ
jgi:flagellar motility protein MotE (MotC chaperone)